MRLRYVPLLALALASAAVVPSGEFPPPIPKSDSPVIVRTGVKDGDVIDVPAGKYADLTIDLPAGSKVITRTTGSVVQRSDGLPDGRMIFAGLGTVKISNTLIDFEKKTFSQLDFTVNFGDPTPPPQPQPGPQPNPGPQPQPTPSGQVARFVVVEDTSKAGPWRGDILGSPKVISWYKAMQGGKPGAIHAIYSTTADPSTLGAEGTKYVALAAGKELPYLWALDSAGKVVTEWPVPKSPDEFVAKFDVHQGDRKLGLTLAAPKLQWKKFGDYPSVPLVPRAQWPKFMAMIAFLPPTHDQDGVGQCASSAGGGVTEFTRCQAGLPYVYLAAGDLYSRVNGGSDNGSLLEDNMSELLSHGISPVSSSAPYVWSRRTRYPGTDRAKYRLAEVYLCPTFDAAVSAILQGYAVEIGISWRANYTPGKDGWLPKNGGRSVGGHALYSYGVAQAADGSYGLVTRNSWGASWGGSADGTIDAGSCVIPETAFTGDISGMYAVRSVVQSSPSSLRLDPFRGEFALAP
jgi:hypothetical protein